MQWIIGDVHGCIHTLEALLHKLSVADNNPKFTFVGDYVDRGLHSKSVVDLMIQLQKEGAICLRGNHDDVIDYMLNGHSKSDMSEFTTGAADMGHVVNWWLCNGFGPCLDSYGCGDGNVYQVLENFREKAEDHKEFFNNLPLYWENDTHFACHAFMRPNDELPRDLKFMPNDRAMETLWSRFAFDGHGVLDTANVNPVWDKIGVFGHTPTSLYGSYVPIKHGQLRLIDTGVFTDNYLTAYCCESDDWILQATDSRDLKKGA